ncbi:sulfite reductase flavoprotein subunit alpha [Xanthomonas sp. AmX2]|uniref:sulfite reductase flavoprotein subunit alpha n=1 Tax=Xanthomonas sp. TaxID=29446 RepID=UPI00197D86B3|nr:sulfite reductase flavoprotein subunit alpha [Xanthomonas sp.]MBN6149784.1 sulfite reductase flavoprotein subunit alpha [Xanthomonas sp.]
MFKKILFQLHWLFGISAGLVLAVMGLSGATLAFQDEIERLANPSLAAVAAQHSAGATTLPLAQLLPKLQAGRPTAPDRVRIDPTGQRLSSARFPGAGGVVHFDPYTGATIAQPRLVGFFDVVEDLHRRLVAGKRGEAVTGACVLILLFFCVSGLYLRWPRQWWRWRPWLAVEWRRSGRSFLWSLHSVVGTWCMAVYLLIALTGLYWSYDWYKHGVTALLGGSAQGDGIGRGGRGAAMSAADLARIDRALAALPDTHGTWLDLRLPVAAGKPLSVRYLPPRPRHSRAYDLLALDPGSGRVLKQQRYAAQPTGRQWLASVFALHSGSYFGLPGRVAVMLASLCMPLFFVSGWLLYLDRRRKQRQVQATRGSLAGAAAGGEPWLVGFASQSGFAEQLAWHSAAQLQAAGHAVQVRPLAQLDPATLAQAARALFVVSTFGDGEAPDSAHAFDRKQLARALPLPRLRYAMLALGDRQYAQYCGFSRRLERWLQQQGAQALLGTVEVDNADARALDDWQQRLATLTGHDAGPAWRALPMQAWTLCGRALLNPGSQGAPVWRIDLVPPARAHWQAGDILEIQPRNADADVRAALAQWRLDPAAPVWLDGAEVSLAAAVAVRELPAPPRDRSAPAPTAQAWLETLAPLKHREYSLASLPRDAVAQLVVRQVRRHDGRSGIGSGWLGEHAPLHAGIAARVRRNPGFHRHATAAPMLLIGNGTGIAGLRSLLREAARDGQGGHWLLFGERNAAHDALFDAELRAWQADGHLRRLERLYSRDQPQRRYVQHRLRECADEVRQWLRDGATLYVCGSLEGMGQEVDAAMREMLGEAELDGLIAAGRYRRDVY